MALSRFRQAKTADEEVNLVKNAVPKSTQYKNKWAYGLFEEWQRQRLVKVPIAEVVGLFKNGDFQVESLETPLVEMSALSVNYWLTKFVHEMANPSKSVTLQEPCTALLLVFVAFSPRINRVRM